MCKETFRNKNVWQWGTLKRKTREMCGEQVKERLNAVDVNATSKAINFTWLARHNDEWIDIFDNLLDEFVVGINVTQIVKKNHGIVQIYNSFYFEYLCVKPKY